MLDHFREIFDKLSSAYNMRNQSCQRVLTSFDFDRGVFFMDLSKALDSLPHGLLIAKLHALYALYCFSTSASELIWN